jgi:hypothetical protein
MRLSAPRLSALFLLGFLLITLPIAAQDAAVAAVASPCGRIVRSEVVAFDQPLMLNRLGTAFPQGMIFALKSDLANYTPQTGNVSYSLRPGKRPRPIVLRMNQGDCMDIVFTNLLRSDTTTTSGTTVTTNPPVPLQPVTRQASVHVMGMQAVASGSSPGIDSDGSFVGDNGNAQVDPGVTKSYRIYAEKMGTFLLYSHGAIPGNNSGFGQLMAGLFGSVNVEPNGAEYYRSQVTRDDIDNYGTTTLQGQAKPPLFNYGARYPANYKIAGLQCAPVLKMVDLPLVSRGGKCVPPWSNANTMTTFHTDLNAVITGPNAAAFPPAQMGPEFLPVSASPDRRLPFREFTILYHEMAHVVQAFNQFYPDPNVLTNGADNLAISYGTGGISAEILANRLHVGPMFECQDCKFEEFFLSSWALGDPAMNVDVPANAPSASTTEQQEWAQVINPLFECKQGTCPTTTIPDPGEGPKATRAYYPDDPSNVYHSYLNDHVKFQILNAGSNASHIHHQHAHQWLHTPDDTNSSYLDSQLLGPGAAYTLEMDYGGSGNRNKTVGDSIFHCHFYPHFAGGMWALWRVHDVFEMGTPLNPDGTVKPNVRAYPDAEIAAGTPIPALVPLPDFGMAPIPAPVQIVPVCKPGITNCTNDRTQWAGTEAIVVADPNNPNKNPGYPFFVPGIAAHRAPHPPYDFACKIPGTGVTCVEYLDGGLARHVVVTGDEVDEHHNQWDFTKNNHMLKVRWLAEDGVPVEKAAIKFFSTATYSSVTPNGGKPASYFTNGLPNGPQHGAPFADPAVIDGKAVAVPKRTYKAAAIQLDVAFSKKGWHYPQERIITLWGDVQKTMNGTRMPEPFFFRANSRDVIEFWHTNLVPAYYDLDDFQVRTPTDILGQHIHLVKFDVLASDGAGNGFNYEDGTFAPDEVVDRINAVRVGNNCGQGVISINCPVAKMPPSELGQAPVGQNWLGAQTTIQRWWADPLTGCLDASQGCGGSKDGDRTLRTVFTHDHFGPSTHQQAGVYAGLLVEPENSVWKMSTTDEVMGSRKLADGTTDGGPTSWEARIETPGIAAQTFREFAIEFQDNSMAYEKTSITQPVQYNPVYTEPLTATSKPFGWADCHHAINGGGCVTDGNALQATPSIIAAAQGTGTMSVNYRNESILLRVDKTNNPPVGVSPNATDLSHVYRSIMRYDNDLNTQPTGRLTNSGNPTNWPLFRYPGPFAGALPTDPYTPLLRAYQGDNVQVRVLVGAYLFQHDFVMSGLKWLFEPSGPNSGYRDHQTMGISEHYEFLFRVPQTPPVGVDSGAVADYFYAPGVGTLDQMQGLWGILRAYNANGRNDRLLSDLKTLPTNPGGGTYPNWSFCPGDAPVVNFDITAIDSTQVPGGRITYNDRFSNGNIYNPAPLIWVKTADLPLKNKPEPLILRANAGDCIYVTLRNAFTTSNSIFTQDFKYGQGYESGVKIVTHASSDVGLRPSLLAHDVTASAAFNVGVNPVQTVAAGTPQKFKKYQWYAGNVVDNVATGGRTFTPVEFGSTNLIASDPLNQQPQSMVGALIIEPRASIVRVDSDTTAQATITIPNPGIATTFREFVAINQNGLSLTWDGPIGGADNVPTVTNAVNFGTEPLWNRLAWLNQDFDQADVHAVFSNTVVQAGGTARYGPPKTPIFHARPGDKVRFRTLHPDGPGGFPDTIIAINGHQWQEEPYTDNSTRLGFNAVSNVQGSRDGVGPQGVFDALIDSAGGKAQTPGDYLYLSFPAFEFPYGNWGIFHVGTDIALAKGMPPQGASTAPPAPPASPANKNDLGRFNVKHSPHEESSGQPLSERPELHKKPDTKDEQPPPKP